MTSIPTITISLEEYSRLQADHVELARIRGTYSEKSLKEAHNSIEALYDYFRTTQDILDDAVANMRKGVGAIPRKSYEKALQEESRLNSQFQGE